MFCPECGGEYRAGFTVCKDCDVELVERLSDDDLDGDAGEEAARGDLVLLGDVFNRHHAAGLAERFELEEIDYVLQYGSGMHHLEGRRLFGRREHGWHGQAWVTPRDLGVARRISAEVVEQLRQESETD